MMSYNNTSTSYLKVIDSTDWVNLEKYRELGAKRGVYVLSNFFYQVKYVGFAGDGELVDKISEAIRNGRSVGATKIKVLYTKSELQAVSLERKLIKRYNPVNNVK